MLEQLVWDARVGSAGCGMWEPSQQGKSVQPWPRSPSAPWHAAASGDLLSDGD